MQQTSKLILGIDPGTQLMGYSVIEVRGKDIRLILMDCKKLTGTRDMFTRLGTINALMHELINTYKPHELAIEAPFFGKNVQSMLKLGRAQGVAIAVAMQLGLPVAEYSPRKIKQVITGNGNADKEQVWKMLKITMQLDIEHFSFDASDALAVAVCHHYQKHSGPQGGKAAKGWEAFIKENPSRVANSKSGRVTG